MPSAPKLAETDKKQDQPRLSRRVGRPPKGRLAYSRPARYKLTSGYASRVATLTEEERNQILALCRCGTDPMTATMKILGVSDQTFKNWRAESQDPNGDERYKVFFAEVGQAFAECRSRASEFVTKNDPLAALTRGPLGRSQPGYPGWTETHEVRHTDHAGEGNPVLRVRLNVGRYGITSEVVKEETRRLEAGDDERDD